MAKEALKATRIKSSVAGTITLLEVVEGDNIGSNSRVASIVDYTRVKAITSVDEFDIRHIKVGMDTRVTADAYPGQEFEGSIYYIAPEAKNDGGLVIFETKIDLDNPRELLRPGMTVGVEIISKLKEEVLLIPSEAVKYKEGRANVLKLAGGEKVYQPIGTGLTDSNNIEVLNGLELGDIIFIEGGSDISKEVSTRVYF